MIPHIMYLVPSALGNTRMVSKQYICTFQLFNQNNTFLVTITQSLLRVMYIYMLDVLVHKKSNKQNNTKQHNTIQNKTIQNNTTQNNTKQKQTNKQTNKQTKTYEKIFTENSNLKTSVYGY